MRKGANRAMSEHRNADLITAYWREVLPHCATKRTAQDHCKKNNPKWIAWLATQGRKVHSPKETPGAVQILALTKRLKESPPGVEEGEDQAPKPPGYGKPIEERTPEEHAEVVAWQMFTENSSAAERLARSDSITAAGFARIACQCLASYHVARAKRVQADIENKRLLPVSEYESLCQDARRLADLWKSLVPDLAAQIDPTNPGRVRNLFEEWIQKRINPVVQRFILNGDLPELAA
jgi:hypothetical protein